MEVGYSEQVVVRERYGQSTLRRDFLQSQSGRLQVCDRSPAHKSLSHFFRTVFLPQGYPESVSKDYLSYQCWDTLQAFASSISGTLAAHSLLHGMGVGDESATVLAATLTWLLKDGTGMLGRIVFAWIKGQNLDCDAKRWRLYADILNDFAICLEIMAPLSKTYFRVVVCVAGVAKSLVGVAGGATRAALTQHQARRNNMADVSAKDGSQETLVNLSALLLSLILLPAVSGHHMFICCLFFLMTVLHLFANYQAVKSVCMESLNQARLHLIMEHYLTTGQVPGVAEVNQREPVLWPIKRRMKIELGASFNCLLDSSFQYQQVKKAYSGLSSQYILYYNKQTEKGLIVLGEDAEESDQLQACVQAELLNFLVTRSVEDVHGSLQSTLKVHLPEKQINDEVAAMRGTYTAVEALLPSLLTSLTDQGWNTSCVLLGAEEWRAVWSFDGFPDKKHF